MGESLKPGEAVLVVVRSEHFSQKVATIFASLEMLTKLILMHYLIIEEISASAKTSESLYQNAKLCLDHISAYVLAYEHQ